MATRDSIPASNDFLRVADVSADEVLLDADLNIAVVSTCTELDAAHTFSRPLIFADWRHTLEFRIAISWRQRGGDSEDNFPAFVLPQISVADWLDAAVIPDGTADYQGDALLHAVLVPADIASNYIRYVLVGKGQ